VKYARVAAFAAALSSFLTAQAVGPDVIVGDLHEAGNFQSGTPIGGAPTGAYSLGTVSCNLGTAELSWFSGTNQKPVIGQSVYRMKDGRFEQIGFGWLKHGFFALAENLCGTCQTPANYGNYLGINCSDPYSASLNGQQSNIGPRFEVNPFTGVYPMPYTLTPVIADNPATATNEQTTLAGRINILHSDVNPALNAGAFYFGEGQYIHPVDASSGNGFNNASYRRVNFAASGANFNMSLTSATVRQKPAIWAWKQFDPTVDVRNVDVPGEGRFVVGYKSTSLGGGQWRHEYAVYNLNSDRAGGSFAVALPAGVSATTPSDHFRDVHYHSGEPQNGVDWTVANVPGSAITWNVVPAAISNQSNALRWGTLYNFRFDANADFLPNITIGLFKAGVPASVSAVMCRAAGLSEAPLSGSGASSVAYDFVDATTGSAGPAGDDTSITVALPFTFNLFGTNLNSVVISTNGYIADASQPGAEFNNTTIPSPGAPNAMIAGYWDDLEVGNVGAAGSSTGWCRYLTTGTAPNRRFVVHWNNAQRFNSNTNVSFQIILDETSNNITITHIAAGTSTTGGSATRGAEDLAGTYGVQVSYNQAGSALAGTSVRITQAPLVYPDTAALTLTGDGSIANPFTWRVVSDPNVALTLFADVAPGPIYIPGLLGNLGLGLTPGLVTIADGTGLFGLFDPSAVTNSCNEWSLSIPVGLDPVPAALIDVWFQALVWSAAAPNGFARTSQTVNY
jgi:hypothetical protein